MLRRPPRSPLFPSTPLFRSVMLGETAGTADKEALRESLGLNRPLAAQYRTFLIDLAAGNLGRSLYERAGVTRSEEHTSELQSQSNLVCRRLLGKKETIRHGR